MKNNAFNTDNTGLIELNEIQLRKIEGGFPWLLIGFVSGALYYLVSELL